METAGIIIQVIAGFLIILRQFEKERVSSFGNTVKVFLSHIRGTPRKRFRFSLIFCLISFPILLLAIFHFSDTILTLGVLGVGILFILIGYNSYLYSLKYLLKLFGFELAKSKQDSEFVKKVALSNVILIVLSAIVISATIQFVILGAGYGIVIQSLLVVGLVVAYLTAVPVFVLSTIYVVLSTMNSTIDALNRISGKIFWMLTLFLWLFGGLLLIVNSIRS